MFLIGSSQHIGSSSVVTGRCLYVCRKKPGTNLLRSPQKSLSYVSALTPDIIAQNVPKNGLCNAIKTTSHSQRKYPQALFLLHLKTFGLKSQLRYVNYTVHIVLALFRSNFGNNYWRFVREHLSDIGTPHPDPQNVSCERFSDFDYSGCEYCIR